MNSKIHFLTVKNFTAITGRETGSNKQTASKSCALSIIRQLFHLGVIEAFTGTLKTRKEGDQMKPYPVKISPDVIDELKSLLDALEVTPINVHQVGTIAYHLKFNP